MNLILIKLVKIYQKYFSFDTGLLRFFVPSPATCRYHPTCSSYACQALERYGTVKGVFLTISRFLRCTPFHKGGYDPVK